MFLSESSFKIICYYFLKVHIPIPRNFVELSRFSKIFIFTCAEFFFFFIYYGEISPEKFYAQINVELIIYFSDRQEMYFFLKIIQSRRLYYNYIYLYAYDMKCLYEAIKLPNDNRIVLTRL